MRLIVIAIVALLAASSPEAWARGGKAGRETRADRPWTQDFTVDPTDLGPTGRNPFFILEPGYQLVLEHGDDQLVITVLGETRTIAGVETRVVEERESEGGALEEVSRNYFAIHRTTRDVFYFGEDVDNYRGGQIVSHSGSWLVDGKTNKPGLIMPGEPSVGMRYYQEMAPDHAMDRAEVVSVTDEVRTPAGHFSGCLRVEETTPLEPREREYKLYARDVGLLSDEGLKLVKHGMVQLPKE